MLNLTCEERKAVVFLCAVFLIGIGVRFYLKNISPSKDICSFSGDFGKVNLNKADKALLMKVSGIGDKLSDRIIELRNARGSFSSVEEIREIKGISAGKFSRIKDYFFVE